MSSSSHMLTCVGCGKTIHVSAEACPRCGAVNDGTGEIKTEDSDHSLVKVALWCLFLGMFGAHRFAVGRDQSAAIQFLTLGGLLIWTMIDFFYIIAGRFKDRHGRLIK